MPELSKKWQDWQDRAFSRVDHLVRSHGGVMMPIGFFEMLREQRIKRVVFRRLPVAGGLMLEGDGFAVYVNCAENDITGWTASIEDQTDGGKSLPSRPRFTIAHEIAHTFFYDVTAPTPNKLISGRHPKELSSLERTCNRAAARLLIPDRFLVKMTAPHEKIDAAVLRDLAGLFGVSIETMVHRLGRSRVWSDKGGAALYVEDEGNAKRVRAMAMDGPCRHLLPDRSIERLVTEWLSANSPMVRRGGVGEEVVDIAGEAGENKTVQTCAVKCLHLEAERSAFLITLHLCGGPRICRG